MVGHARVQAVVRVFPRVVLSACVLHTGIMLPGNGRAPRSCYHVSAWRTFSPAACVYAAEYGKVCANAVVSRHVIENNADEPDTARCRGTATRTVPV